MHTEETMRAEKIRRKHYTIDTSKDIMPAVEKIVREAKR